MSPQVPPPPPGSLGWMAQMFQELGACVGEAAVLARDPGAGPEAFRPTRDRLEALAGRLEEVRDRLWLRQHKTQLLEEGPPPGAGRQDG